MEVHGGLYPGSVSIVPIAPLGDPAGAIRAHDAAFDATDFLAHVEEVRAAVLQGLHEHNAGLFTKYVGPSLLPSLKAQAEGSAPVAISTQAAHGGAVIKAAHTDASYDTIAAGFSLASGVENWTFQRSSKATTGGAAVVGTCPECGAPLTLDADGKCTYCHAPFTGASTTWMLVRIEQADDFSAFGTMAVSSGGGAGAKIGIGIGILGVIGAIAAVIAVAVSHHSSAITVNFGNSSPAGSTPAAPAGQPSLAANLTLTGGISLSPSDLNPGELILNGGGPGLCAPKGTPVQSLTLDVTFDDGGKLQGAITFAAPLQVGVTEDASTGGSATLHEIGPTQATADDQVWLMSAGQTGAVTGSLTSTGGTLKWQNLASQEPDHNDSDPMSGLLTWTCS